MLVFLTHMKNVSLCNVQCWVDQRSDMCKSQHSNMCKSDQRWYIHDLFCDPWDWIEVKNIVWKYKHLGVYRFLQVFLTLTLFQGHRCVRIMNCNLDIYPLQFKCCMVATYTKKIMHQMFFCDWCVFKEIIYGFFFVFVLFCICLRVVQAFSHFFFTQKNVSMYLCNN